MISRVHSIHFSLVFGKSVPCYKRAWKRQDGESLGAGATIEASCGVIGKTDVKHVCKLISIRVHELSVGARMGSTLSGACNGIGNLFSLKPTSKAPPRSSFIAAVHT